MGFVVPGPEDRERAVGGLGGLPPELERAFMADGDFEPVPPPGRMDWLSIARERGQTFERFVRGTSSRRDDGRACIYLQPVGDFAPEASDVLRRLQRFGSAFFAREVRLLEARPADAAVGRRRNRFTGVVQLKTRDLLPQLARSLPVDAACVLGVTMSDLYPHDIWSFVFGEALVDDRVGVISLARYDPRFYDRPADPALLLSRSCKVLAHEVCHMFGLLHCVYFNCLMNGSNHLDESDRRPLHLCPVDLRKLHWSLGFDPVERYRQLRDFWRESGLSAEAGWIERRLNFIQGRA